MFGRKDKTLNQEQAEAVVEVPRRRGPKNGPTPKRKDQEAARKQPLVQTDRKLAREKEKLARREQQAKMREAMATGEDRYLPARDKGPERRYIRDYVDARRSIGEILLPTMVLVLALSFVKQPWALTAVFVLTYGLILIAVVDCVILWRRLKPQLLAKFGDDGVPRGAMMYAVMRAFQMRRTRMPRPQVKRGEFPA